MGKRRILGRVVPACEEEGPRRVEAGGASLTEAQADIDAGPPPPPMFHVKHWPDGTFEDGKRCAICGRRSVVRGDTRLCAKGHRESYPATDEERERWGSEYRAARRAARLLEIAEELDEELGPRSLGSKLRRAGKVWERYAEELEDEIRDGNYAIELVAAQSLQIKKLEVEAQSIIDTLREKGYRGVESDPDPDGRGAP